MTPNQAFPEHVFHALRVASRAYGEPIGGMVRVVEKRPVNGPVTLMTIGASRLPTDSGESVELAVEVLDGQQEAGRIALKIVCDDIASNRRVPPLGTPWRNREPFLTGTRVSAIMVSPSRWGAAFDDVRSPEGAVVGHVRTLRLLTDAEAAFAAADGWEALCRAAGSVDELLDVTRSDVVGGGGVPDDLPVILSKLHDRHPPRWVTFTGTELQSVTGLESDDYMDDADNHEIWSAGVFVQRFPWVADFVRTAAPGQTALFSDDSGGFVLEDD